jgi:hypothetical protein
VRPDDRERHAFALLLVLSSVFLMYLTGVFSAQFTTGVQDRYLYFLVVPFFVGSAAWLANMRPRIWALAAAAAIAAWVVLRASLSLQSPSLVSPSGGWHKVLFGRVAELNHHLGNHWLTAPRALAIATVAAAGAILLARRLRPGWSVVPFVVVAGLGAYLFAETQYTMNGIKPFEQKRTGGNWAVLDWIDDRVPSGAKVPVLMSDMGSPGDASAIWNHTRFWNASTREALVIPNTNTMDQQYRVNVEFDEKRGAIPQLEDIPRAVHAVLDRRYQLQGMKRIWFQDSLELVSLPGTGKLDWLLHANNEAGLVPAHEPATLRVFPPGGNAMQRFTLAITPNYQAAGDHYDYVLEGGGVNKHGRVKVGKTVTVTFDVRPPAGGFSDLHLRAIGRVDRRYPLGGLLIQDLHSQPVPRHAPG